MTEISGPSLVGVTAIMCWDVDIGKPNHLLPILAMPYHGDFRERWYIN